MSSQAIAKCNIELSTAGRFITKNYGNSTRVKKKFYISTAIDYANAPPHIGHLYEKVCADSIARWHRLRGEDVFFLTGTDENAQKNEKAAKEAKMDVMEFVNRNSHKFKELCVIFGISNDDFIRTTEERHSRLSKQIYKKLFDNGDIYKGKYEGYYCYGCEEYKSERDLVDGKCPEHDTRPEWLKEESYFFRLSRYQDRILDLLEDSQFVLPVKRKNEIMSRIRLEGLKDLSVSRTNVTWGIDTPIDSGHKIYVWIDALVNYISALGYPDSERYERYWPADVHLIGKGINWFHSVVWPAILLSAKIPLPKLILVHGYLTIDGKKISKSKGNIIDPFDLAKRYQVDAIRYFLLMNMSFNEDGDFTERALAERINNELVANIGNFVHRTLTFIWHNFSGEVPEPDCYDEYDKKFVDSIKGVAKEVNDEMDANEVDKGLKRIVEFTTSCNQYFQQKEPWKTKDHTCLYLCANALRNLAILLKPFTPFGADELWKQLGLEGSINNQRFESASELNIEANHKINQPQALFRKVEDTERKEGQVHIIEGSAYDV